MYVPPAFDVRDRAWALDLIRRYPFGMLITCAEAYPFTTHLPMLAQERGDGIVILGHVARANAHAQAIGDGSPATAVFVGPHAFVSALWYEAPYETVPTWNYVAVHASGRLKICDPLPVLRAITARFEGEDPAAWSLDGLQPSYLENQCRGIVAFELAVQRLEAKAKLSQNRSPEDRRRVMEALAGSTDPTDRACAQEMQRGV
jgi:transcriptional regulator